MDVGILSVYLFRVNIDNHLVQNMLRAILCKLNLEARFYYILQFCELLMKPGHARTRAPSSSTAAATRSGVRFELIVMFVKIQND